MEFAPSSTRGEGKEQCCGNPIHSPTLCSQVEELVANARMVHRKGESQVWQFLQFTIPESAGVRTVFLIAWAQNLIQKSSLVLRDVDYWNQWDVEDITVLFLPSVWSRCMGKYYLTRWKCPDLLVLWNSPVEKNKMWPRSHGNFILCDYCGIVYFT